MKKTTKYKQNKNNKTTHVKLFDLVFIFVLF